MRKNASCVYWSPSLFAHWGLKYGLLTWYIDYIHKISINSVVELRAFIAHPLQRLQWTTIISTTFEWTLTIRTLDAGNAFRLIIAQRIDTLFLLFVKFLNFLLNFFKRPVFIW